LAFNSSFMIGSLGSRVEARLVRLVWSRLVFVRAKCAESCGKQGLFSLLWSRLAWAALTFKEGRNAGCFHLCRGLAFRECRHRGLARRGVAVRRRAVLVIAERERPHPGRANGRGVYLHDPPDGHAVGEHVKMVIVPLAG